MRRKRTVVSILSCGALAAGFASCQVLERAQTFDLLGSAQDLLSGEAYSAEEVITRNILLKDFELPTNVETYFGAVAGGGAPSYNEIALEKNLLYFQRSLTERGFSPDLAHLFFASSNDWEETIRYLDENGEEQFKAAEIPNLDGGATPTNMYSWFDAIATPPKSCPSFFYFTGHGAYNPDNEDNNWLILWDEAFVSVKEFVGLLDPLPADQPFVTMMAQCYSGSFANMIYEEGDPEKPVALQTRCGFFATVASRPSVGCTPAVNEADYKDYSSSFFAGLTGQDRIGNSVTSADYNTDGTISYAEAHAFAKVDEETTDWPISTVEAWLQRQISDSEAEEILAMPMDELNAAARPEQRYVITSLAEKIGFGLSRSYVGNRAQNTIPEANTAEEAYHVRLKMELINVGAEQTLRQQAEPDQLAILDKIINCEAGTWQ
ncbi:MAG: Caspase domain-containing protein [Phormidesmis sp.]